MGVNVTQSSLWMPNMRRRTPHRQRGLFQITTFMGMSLLLSSQQYDAACNETDSTEEEDEEGRDQSAEDDSNADPEAEHPDEVSQTVHSADHTPYTAV